MHELGVVFHCIEQVNKIAEANNVKKVSRVTVELGEVSTVIPYLFEDCWNWAVKRETVLKDCELQLDIIHALTFCEGCEKVYDTVTYGRTCPFCGSEKTYLKTGNEIIIKEIEASE